MNKNQKLVYKSLEIIANSIMTLEDAYVSVQNLNEKQLKDVLNKFSETITDFDLHELFENSDSFRTCAESLVIEICNRLDIKYN